MDALVMELAEEYISKDTPLSLTYLVSLFKFTSNSAKLFDKILSRYDQYSHNTEKITRLACYFYSLQLLVKVKDHSPSLL